MKSTELPTTNPSDFDEIVAHALQDVDLRPDQIPPLELYMDQILTLFNDTLSKNCRRADEAPLTKTMINNYSKEKLLTPVQGKKYSREQLMQLLCVLTLKQSLSLADIKALMPLGQSNGFERAYGESLRAKDDLREMLGQMAKQVRGAFSHLEGKEQDLATVLLLSTASAYLQRICEGIVDASAASNPVPPQ